MKTYRATDTIQPIVLTPHTSDVDSSNALVAGPALIVMGVAMWVPHSPFTAKVSTEDVPYALMVFGFGLALIIAGLMMLSKIIPPLARFGTRHRLLIRTASFIAFVTCFGPFLCALFFPGVRWFGLLVVPSFIANFALVPLWLLEHFNAKRIVRKYRSARGSGIRSAPGLQPKTELAHPGELVIELYDADDDLPHPPRLRPVVTGDANICGERPVRILYLYNFFADEFSVTRQTHGWRLHGPVSMLASPLELARAVGYKLNLSRAFETKLAANPALIKERIAAMSDEPLPPETTKRANWLGRRIKAITDLRGWFGVGEHRALPAQFAGSGAYPEHILPCTDQTWHQGIAALSSRCEKVVMNAANFRPDRHGLVWEIHHVLNHFATEDVAVLINGLTDFPKLAREFWDAWSAMDANSPNNRPGVARLRFVLFLDKSWNDWDQVNYCDDIYAHHGIMTLLRSAEI